jgi:YfiR/HmsC-like
MNAKLIVTLAGCLATASWGCSTALGQSASEYQVKAAFLYNFAKFVEWPAPSFKGLNDPINICVVGQNPFGSMLEDTVRGKTLEGRAFVVRNLPDVQQAGGCHILFVSSAERRHMRSILESIKTPGVLTVGETEGFAMNGGVINFKLDEGRVRFEINLEAAAAKGLQI